MLFELALRRGKRGVQNRIGIGGRFPVGGVSQLAAHHQLFAWLSLVWIAWTDFYVFLVASGRLTDPKIF